MSHHIGPRLPHRDVGDTAERLERVKRRRRLLDQLAALARAERLPEFPRMAGQLDAASKRPAYAPTANRVATMATSEQLPYLVYCSRATALGLPSVSLQRYELLARAAWLDRVLLDFIRTGYVSAEWGGAHKAARALLGNLCGSSEPGPRPVPGVAFALRSYYARAGLDYGLYTTVCDGLHLDVCSRAEFEGLAARYRSKGIGHAV